MSKIPSASELAQMKIGHLLDRYPFISSFFSDEKVEHFIDEIDHPLSECLSDKIQTEKLTDSFSEDFLKRFHLFIEEMLDFIDDPEVGIESLTIIGGQDKKGNPEAVKELTINKGEIICIVGPTGSGKSRLLADIEWVAQGDTPTKRKILIDGEVPQTDWRFSADRKLVAQLSQNMNFVMDLSAEEFLALHAESRGIEKSEEIIKRILETANDLAGEQFEPTTPITALSGGQSRALMIADTAILSNSPIVLIDEIENAGIDRRKALDILLEEEKIVLLATHDPILALWGDKRIVIGNGAMQKVLLPTTREKKNAERLEALDQQLMNFRQRLRQGELLEDVDIIWS